MSYKKTTYKHGDHNVICDRTGFKVKRSQCIKTWDGFIVLKEHAEPRHPQDFLRAGRPERPVYDSRPEQTDYFVTGTEAEDGL